jgi:glycosyltransferase involved in cell wall biosynthesis
MRGFQQIDAEMHESPFNPPDNPHEYAEIFWGDPAHWNWFDGDVKLRVGYALSEHRSLLHPDKAIPNLQKSDLLLCPCESAAAAYYEAPLEMPIKIAPFGVDEEEMAFHERDWEAKPFKFLVIGAAQFRKGTWIAVESFRRAFGDSNNVHLSVASFLDSSMYTRLKTDFDRYDNITFFGKASEAKEYYDSHHVLISPHLAEGWGLTIPEAMSTGMACIISRCSAPREYFNHKYGWWIEMSDQYAPVDQCLEGVSGSWRLPSPDSLAEKLVYAAEHPDECRQKGELSSQYVRDKLTWKQSAIKILDILEEYE